MSGYIEKESAEIVIKKLISSLCSPFDKQDALDELNSIPIADVESVRHGHWVASYVTDQNTMQRVKIYTCSDCNRDVPTNYPSCPYCRAKMDEEENS